MFFRIVILLVTIAGICFTKPVHGQEIFRSKKHIRNSFVKTVTSWACCPSFCDKPGEARKKVKRNFDEKGNELRREFFYTSLEPQMIHFFEYEVKSGYLNIKSPLQTKYIYDPQKEDTTAWIQYYYKDKKLRREVRYESSSDSLITLYFYKNGLNHKIIRFNNKGLPREKTQISYNKDEQPVKKRRYDFSQAQDTLTGFFANHKKAQKLSEANWELNETRKLQYNDHDLVSVKITHLPDGSTFSSEKYSYTIDQEMNVVKKLHFSRKSGEQQQECIHYYQYEFYEHY